MESALRILDNMEEVEESKSVTSNKVKDTAKVSNLTASELKQRSKGVSSNPPQKINKTSKITKEQSFAVAPEDADADPAHLKAFLIGIYRNALFLSQRKY